MKFSVRLRHLVCAAFCVSMLVGSFNISYGTTNTSALIKDVQKQMAQNESEIDVSMYDVKIDDANYHKLVDTIYYQSPELFQVSDLGFTYGATSKKISTISPSYRMDNSKYKKLLAAAKKNRKKFKGNSYKKVCQIHKYLIKKIAYKKSRPGLDRALVDKKTNCMGYSAAFQWLCQYNGITCVTVSDTKETHMWNKVKISGKWYNVDCTMDDNGSKVRYTYLLVKDSVMRKHKSSYKAKKTYSRKMVKKYSK